jgi:hypothetical protein
VDPPVTGSPVRLSELVASLSLATDLGLGQPMEHVLRSCVLGLRIAEDLQLDESERAVVYTWRCSHGWVATRTRMSSPPGSVDGKGTPAGIAGEEIALSARIDPQRPEPA